MKHFPHRCTCGRPSEASKDPNVVCGCANPLSPMQYEDTGSDRLSIKLHKQHDLDLNNFWPAGLMSRGQSEWKVSVAKVEWISLTNHAMSKLNLRVAGVVVTMIAFSFSCLQKAFEVQYIFHHPALIMFWFGVAQPCRDEVPTKNWFWYLRLNFN